MPSEDFIRTVRELLRKGEVCVEDAPLEDLDSWQHMDTSHPSQCEYSTDDLISLASELDEIILHGGQTMTEVFRRLSHRLQSFFSSRFVEFVSLKGNELTYEYVTAPAWVLRLIHAITGITAVVGMQIPLFEGSSFKELIDKKQPRELITFEERARSLRDFVEPSTKENIELRRRATKPLMALLGYRYVFQVPLAVRGEVIGFFSFLRTTRFSKRVRADLVLLSARISHLLLLKMRDAERIASVSEGTATVEVLGDNLELRISDTTPAFRRLASCPDASALVGQKIETVFEELKDRIDDLAKVHLLGTPITFEQHIASAQKTLRFVVSKGGFENLIVVAHDISEQKEAERERKKIELQMQRAQKIEGLGMLAGGIAHEFNNLLMVIGGNTELLGLDLAPGSENASFIQEILRATDSAADITRQMLAYSGRGKRKVVVTNLTALVESMLSFLRASTNKNADLEVALAESLPPIRGDALQIQQVVLNIVLNAGEALVDEQGTVKIATGATFCTGDELAATYVNDALPEGQYVYLDVEDSGAGMDERTRSRLCDPFFSTKFLGRGLGMAAALGIVRGHRGAIRISSEPGKGTTVRVLLPVCASEQPKPRKPLLADPSQWRAEGTVLVADDEKAIRDVARRLLENRGLTVLEATSGQEAVELFIAHKAHITCVLLDLTMKGMSGAQTMAELRQIRSDVPIILSSGYSKDHVPDLRAAAFVQKPYRAASLNETLRKVLAPHIVR